MEVLLAKGATGKGPWYHDGQGLPGTELFLHSAAMGSTAALQVIIEKMDFDKDGSSDGLDAVQMAIGLFFVKRRSFACGVLQPVQVKAHKKHSV